MEAEIAELLRRAAEIDEAEDAEYGMMLGGMNYLKNCGGVRCDWPR